MILYVNALASPGGEEYNMVTSYPERAVESNIRGTHSWLCMCKMYL
jgi:hypothetical protein